MSPLGLLIATAHTRTAIKMRAWHFKALRMKNTYAGHARSYIPSNKEYISLKKITIAQVELAVNNLTLISPSVPEGDAITDDIIGRSLSEAL